MEANRERLQERNVNFRAIAAGLAHEIRNPLHAIRLNLHALALESDTEKSLLSPVERRQVVSESTTEIRRIDGLLEELIRYAAPNASEPRTIELGVMVRGAIETARHGWQPDRLQLQIERGSALPYIHVDPNRMTDALARVLEFFDARLQGRGTLTVVVSRDPHTCWITFRDDGPPLDSQGSNGMFEPFSQVARHVSGFAMPIVRQGQRCLSQAEE